MSRRKPVILGPDGKPYVAPPKPAAKKKAEATPVRDGGSLIPHSFFNRMYGLSIGGLGDYTVTNGVKAVPEATPTLADAVAGQVAALTATFEGVGGEELPKPALDLDTYEGAFASAAANCKHPDAEDTMHSRGEFYCPDCRRYISRAEYRKTRGGFGGFFGW